MDSWREQISFILLDTREAGNIGASARALKNCGFARLELVRPRSLRDGAASWFAHGADDMLRKAVVHETLDSALRDKTVIVGTTRRVGRKRGAVYGVREAVGMIRGLSSEDRVAVLFGREDRGLTNIEAANCSFMIHIPSAPDHPSFNLAQAVLIVAYELSSTDFVTPSGIPVISNDELSVLFERVRRIMTLAGYAPKGIRDNEEAVMADLRRIMTRAGINEREARMLHGIISQIEAGLSGSGE